MSWKGGEFDSTNEALNLSGDKRVIGLVDAWDKLTKQFTPEQSVAILRESPGLENLNLPAKYMEATLTEHASTNALADFLGVDPTSKIPPVVSISALQNLRSTLSGVAYRGDNLIDGMDKRQERYFARQVLKAIDADIEKTATAGGEGAQLLKDANGIWRHYAQQLEAATTDTVEKILGVSKEAGDTIISKMTAGSAGEISAAFKVLRAADPEAANVAWAQYMDNLLTKANKPARSGLLAGEEVTARIQPKTALTALTAPENRAKILAAADGDLALQKAYIESVALLKRVAFGPGIKGSTTAPQLAQEALDSGVSAAIQAAPVGQAVRAGAGWINGVVQRIIGNDRMLNQVYTNLDAIRIFNTAMKAQLSGKIPTGKELMVIQNLADVLGLELTP